MTSAPGRSPAPLELTVWYDYHCPYSRRAVAWLDGLGPARVRPAYRAFALEQVNVDPAAIEWQIWTQPLDYEHYRGRQDRRGLAALLATELLAAAEEPGVVARFRAEVYAARFDRTADIADPATLAAAAVAAGATSAGNGGGALLAALADETALTPARARLAADWAAARAEWEVFGVPTLQFEGDAPIYLRLEREPDPGAEAVDLLDRLVGLGRAAPYVLEVKRPEPAS
jgi:hypothetical protein